MNQGQRKNVVKDFIARVLTKSLIREDTVKIDGFKERLQQIIDPNSRKSSFEVSLKRVSEIQEQMNGLVEHLDSKMDSVLEKREKEFLSAYQSHMIEVQNELLHLKRKANEKELQLQQDDKILSLEQELAWIRQETMKVREEIDNQEVIIKDYKQEQQELFDDSRFLKMNLKQQLKDKLYEEAKELDEKVETSKESNEDLLQIEDQMAEEDKHELEPAQSEEPQEFHQEEYQDNVANLDEEGFSNDSKKIVMNTMPLKTEDVTKIDYILTDLFESGKSKEEILNEVKSFCIENQERRKRVLQIHRRTLERKRRIAQLARTTQPTKSADSQKNLVYFMQCVERVKMEVKARKKCDSKTLRTKNRISLFNTSDKRRIMELLLCKEDILTKVLIKIFRKMKIKDLEKKVEFERRANKYHSSAITHSFKRTGMSQNSSNTGAFGIGHRKNLVSYGDSQRMFHKYSKVSQSHTPNSHAVRYDASAPVHMLNREIDLGMKQVNQSAIGQ
ncbi:unnamed protein product [Moneuplotes crassus]|uniref:Uncharacterized protein n=1 Tax=Euplotes crassus TaxID=5936 RepID=A0AAD1UHK7_EUPCR|nr:unnamed protein product [Moneuplotes crassus]